MAWNHPSEPVKPVKKKNAPNALRGVLAGLLVVAALVAVLIVFMRDASVSDSGSKTIKKPSAVKQVKPVSATKTTQGPARKTAHATESPAPSETAKVADAEVNQSSTNASSRGPEVPFKTGSDQLIGMVMSSSGKGAMPPLPGLTDEDTKQFVDSLKTPIQIDPNDSERIKRLKELVQNTREEIAQILVENPNMSFADVLQEHRKLHNENLEIKDKTEAELQSIIDSGDIEGAKKFRTVMNLALQQMGVEEMTTPITEEERAEAAQKEEEAEAEEEALDQDEREKRELKAKKEVKK